MINRFPSHILENKNPLENPTNFYPHFKISNGFIPRIFRCTTFVCIYNQNRDKLDPWAVRCVFLGYSATQKDYKCYSPSSKELYISIDSPSLKLFFFFYNASSQEVLSEDFDNHLEPFVLS